MTRLSFRAAVVACITVLAVSCGGGGGGSGGTGGGGGGGGSTPPPVTPPVTPPAPPPPPPPPPVNHAPTAVDDVIRVDGAALASINVIANDTDPDGDKLTVTIEEPALIGTATANADGTVRLDALPGDFKGFTRFRYRVTDAGGLTSAATAAIFTGGDPFRVIFAGDATANGAFELYLLNLLSPPVQLTNATDGALRLTGFAASTNGTTTVYSRASTTTPSTTDLSFVRTSTPKQDVHIAFPAGTTLAPDSKGRSQFAVSSDGQWIVAIARDGTGIESAYVLNVASPTTVNRVNIPGAMRASLPRFSNDSQRLFLLASPATNDANDDLFTVSLNGLTVTQVSQPTAVNSNDDVLDYAVASDQSRILLRANRAGRVGLFYINPSQLQTESKVSHNLALDETIRETTVDQPPGAGGSVLTQKVGYTVESANDFTTWLADVSATPNPHVIAKSGARVRGFRPDDGALTYTSRGQIYEASVSGSVSDQPIGAGTMASYDSTGNIVLLQQSLPSGGTPSNYPALAVSVRGTFGTTQAMGTPVLAAHYVDVSGFDRGVAIVGEGPITGAAPATAKLALVHAMAPTKLIYLADFPSPLNLQTSASQIVKN